MSRSKCGGSHFFPDPFQRDLDGDGIFGETGAGVPSGDEVGWTPTFYAVDGPGSRAVWLRVADVYGQVSYGAATLTITEEPNAPVVQVNGLDSVNEGGSVTLTATHSSNWSGEVSYAWSLRSDGMYGNDSDETGDSVTLNYDWPSTYSVSVFATDPAGHRARAFKSIQVINVLPSNLNLTLSDADINEGETTTPSGSFSDPGAQDTHTLDIDWGDGDWQTVDLAPGVTTFNGITHQYTRPKDTIGTPYPIDVWVTDADFAFASADTTVMVHNLPPTIVQGPAAGSTTVTSTSTTLSVLGADAAGEGNLIYHWSVTEAPEDESGDPVEPSLSINDCNAAKDTTVTFPAIGSYTFSATIADPYGGSTPGGTVTVVVLQGVTSLTITPDEYAEYGTTVYPGDSLGFNLAATDQFGDDFTPPSITWAATPLGYVDSGTYHAPTINDPSLADGQTHPVTVSTQADGVFATAKIAVAGRILAYRSDNSSISFQNYLNDPDPPTSPYDANLVSFQNNLTPVTSWQPRDYTQFDISDFVSGYVTFRVYDTALETERETTLNFPHGATAVGWLDLDFDEYAFDPQSGGIIVIRVWGPNQAEGPVAEGFVSIAATPYVTIADANPVAEGDTAYFTVYLSSPTTGATSLSYHTENGTGDGAAIAGTDYQQHLITDQPGLFTSGAVLALRTILFSRTDSHFASLIPPHPIGEAADMAKNADSATKNRLFPC